MYVGVVLLLVLLLGVWLAQKVSKRTEIPVSQEQTIDQGNDQNVQEFVTDIDPDVNHWQTKETEFFTITFPKEWYWLESDLVKTGYHSQVITNNPNFDIDKYSDIGVFTGGNYRIVSENGESEPLLLRDAEIIISTNGLGSVTSNTGTSYEFMTSEIKSVRDVYKSAECYYTSDITNIPLTAYCSYIDQNSQRVETYYISNEKHTFVFTSRTVRSNNLILKDTLEKIAKSFIVKNVPPFN